MKDEGSGKKGPPLQPSRGEFDFIERIRRRAANRHPRRAAAGSRSGSHHSSPVTHHSSLSQGIGDDAAVIRQRAGRETVITTDLLVEGIDFRLATTRPHLLGWRALAVSLSDIAAMGAAPLWSLLSVGVPREIWDTRFLDDFYKGFFALADEHGVTLVGGDVSRTPGRVLIDSIVLGEVVRGRAILRSGARPGDHIFVTGSLGGAAAGLRLMDGGAGLSERRPRSSAGRAVEQLLLRQLCPVPRVRWGLTLGEERLAAAMIDISDGLSSDLAHLCRESRVGARIEAARIPFDPLIAETLERSLDPLWLALHGGEDFELLLTVRPRDLSRLPRRVGGVPLTYLGDVTAEPGRIQVITASGTRELEAGGFRHF